MIYTEPLPRAADIIRLGRAIDSFPVNRLDIERIARQHGTGVDVVHFLGLFPEDEAFQSRQEFLARSDELLFLIREEERAEAESLLSPQD